LPSNRNLGSRAVQHEQHRAQVPHVVSTGEDLELEGQYANGLTERRDRIAAALDDAAAHRVRRQHLAAHGVEPV
jgi:hypothetical protein